MIPDKLKQIDENIIELLRDRLSLLATSKVPSPEEQVSAVTSLLAEAAIPESIWASLVNSCHTALTTTASSSFDNIRPRKITIIGGRGKMGKFFREQLQEAGHNVSILEQEDWERADKLLGEAELVLVSVPIEWTVDVIKRAAKYLTPKTAIADITSIKTQPVQAMLAYHPGPVMGLHPMFGPNIKTFSGQKVVICPGRDDKSFQWFLDFINSKKGEIITCTPEEHDHIMVIVQATQHFSRFCLGVFLAQEKIDIERSLLMSSPSYRQEIEIVNRLFAQSPHLCADIMLATEERCQEIAKLANTYKRLAQLVANKNRAALIREFAATQRFFNDENSSSQKSDELNHQGNEIHANRYISRHRLSVVSYREKTSF